VDQNADEAKLVIDGCSFVGNRANDHAGAVFLYTHAVAKSDCPINATTFHDNAVVDPQPAVGLAGALYSQYADLTVTSCTFSENSTVGSGGAIWMISNFVSRIADCTFFRNHCEGLGGAINASQGPVYVSCVTIAENTAGVFGAGIHTRPDPDLWIKSSVLVDNVAGDPWNGHNVSRTLKDGGGNMQWPVKRTGTNNDDTPMTDTVIFADPLLGALLDRGGPTHTMSLLPGSPAIDAGSDTKRPVRDQRGYERNGTCDIGAFEVQ